MGSIGAVSMEFCFDVLKELKVHHANENYFYAPFTMFSALAMIYLGAKDSTRAQINKVVRFDKLPGFGDSIEAQCGTSADPQVHSSLRDILNQITKPNDAYSFSLASRLYADEKYSIVPEYLKCVKELYRGDVESINFQTAADQARGLINSWVESQTNGMIKNVLQPSSVDSQTAMVLVNAVVFKGLWEKAFKEEDTQAIPFRVTEQESKPVQMMHQIGLFKVASVPSEKMKILELPFASGTMSMWVLLPDEVSGLEQLETTISFEKMTEWTSSNIMEERKIRVYLPRMKMEEKYNLTSILMAMGMTDLFSSSANLSGISSVGSLKISQAVHAAYAEIYEAGREVAGSAEAAMDATSVSEEFRVDHPFLYCIKHNPSNTLLFLGRCIFP
ncbi:ovalbumin isoform X2 [Phasianus colchicus]|uniref:Serpin domain-containing protein n=2 Tax=Phasianus colchicus TaxID=9054 RepID=A0A669P6F8_PHACC|nr:ovalbumin isoform X2 [Phasianus colchicus]